MKNITLEQLQSDRLVAAEAVTKIDDLIREKKANTLVQCTSSIQGDGCGMGMTIKDLEYIQTHWYEGPHGCTGGDNWHQGEGNFVCPNCGNKNRLYDRPEIQDLKRLFKSVVEEHES